MSQANLLRDCLSRKRRYEKICKKAEEQTKEGNLMRKRETLSHSTLGQLPARQVLNCIFALSPTGTILHFHQEEVTKTELGNDGILYTMNGQTPAPERARCRVIPPFVREFDAPKAA
jgi:hypothetical protein